MHHTTTALSAICAIALSAGASHASVPAYTLAGSFDAPGGAWSVLDDGRLITVDASGVIRTQDVAGSSSYSVIGAVDGALINQFGASFVSVSPDGQTLAIGDGNFGGASVHTVALADLSAGSTTATTAFAVGSFDAVWLDNDSLAISGASNDTFASVVTRLDLDTGDTAVLINDLGGASGGIAFDGAYLYTGNGFQFAGPSGTGEVRAFDLADLGGGPVSFENDGLTVASALSAATIDFDAQGNMLVGGGDSVSGDSGYGAVIDGDLIAAALSGGGASSGATLQLVADPSDTFQLVRFNDATGEVLVDASGFIYRFQVPAPSTGAFAGLALYAAARRRRGA